VVRELFDRNEQELELLRQELDAACREAEAAESRARTHPALGLLTPGEVTMLVPPDRGSVHGREPEDTPPRTTVDRRSRSVGAPVPAHEAGGAGGASADDDGPSRVGRLVTSHWVWRVGVAVVVVALVLLKVG
jgi:hypothetical protein